MAAPELRLDVRLNLATFRTDLGRAAQAAAAYYYPINLLINKQNLTKQLTAIGRSLGTTKYNIDLNDTSVDLAAGKIDKLAASLKKLSGSIQIDFNAGGGTKPIGTAMKEMAAKLAKESKGDINRAVEQMTGMRGASPFGAGTRSISGFKAAAKGMGIENAFKLFFQELQQVDPQSLKKALDDGSVMMMQENRELKQKFDKIQSSAEGLAQDLRAMGETAKATGKASFTAGGKTLYPQNYGLKIASLLSQVEKLDKDLRNVSGQSGGELLNNLTELSSVLRTTSNSFVGLAGLSENLDQTLRGFDTATKTAASATIAYTERIRRRGGIEYGPSTQRLLPPSSTLSLREIGETMAQRYQAPSREIKGLLPAGGKTPGEAITEAYIAKLRSSFSSSRNAIAGLLPAGVGRVPSVYSTGSVGGESREQIIARREQKARVRSALRGVALGEHFTEQKRLPGTTFMGDNFTRGGGRDRVTGSGQPPQRGGALALKDAGARTPLSLDYYKNAFKYSEALKVADASTRNFSASQIPLIGGIKNLAGEFGQAAKQVLLYGTAYKGLAFLTSLPGQILNAAKSQQQFANGLKTATQDTGTFAKELLYVDNVQRAFGLNLETTRTGFTRLYASMAPTGFDSGSIEKLFTGISAATASLQLTPDKAERVIYAFGQMASKGQIMSEELKGQLGDVLPGALAIFAKSAGMSVKEFSKAMEDGEFVGNRFREVFAKVSDELMNRFGTGAQAAGKSLQGLINTVGGDFRRVMESFSPLANSAAQAILGPLGGSLKQLALSAQIATGEIERVFMQLKDSQQELKDLQDSAGTDGIITAEESKQIKAAEQNVGALTLRYKALQKAASDPAIAKQAEDITRFTEELAKAGTFVMNVAQTIGGMLSPVLNFLGGNLTTVIGLITTFYIGFQTARLAAMALMGVLLLYRGISTILGFSTAAQQATVLSGAFSVLGINISRANIALIGTRAALTALVAATVIGAVVAGIIAIASAFATMKDRAKEAAEESKRAIEEGGRAASMGMTMGVTTQLNQELAKNRAVAKGIEILQKVYDRNKGKMIGTKPIVSVEEMARLQAAAEYSNEIAGMISGNQFKDDGFQIDAFQAPDLSRAKKQAGQISAEVRKSSTILKAQQRQSQAAEKELGLNKPTPGVTPPEEPKTPDEDKKKTSLESYYSLQDQLAKNFTQAEIDRLEAEHQHKIDLIKSEYNLKEARANSFQKEALRFERRMAEITLERQGALLKAANAVMAAQGSVAGGADGGGSPVTGATGLLQGSTGISGGAHFHISRADGSPISADQARAMLDPSVRRQVTKTSDYGPRRAPVPGASTFHRGVDLAGPANTPLNLAPGYSMVGQGEAGGLGYAASIQGPQGEMYKVGHLQRPAAGAGAARKVPGSETRDIVADQKTQLEQVKQSATARQAEAKAIKDAEVALADFVATATPVEEQKLQNDLLKRKTELMMQGYSDSAVEQALKFAEAEYKVNFALKLNDELQKKEKGQKAEADAITKQMTEGLTAYSSALEENTKRLRDNRLVQAITTLKDRMSMAGAMTPDQELREQIRQKNPDFLPAEQESLFQQEKLVQSAEKLKADMQGIAGAIGDSFGNAFKGVITGSMTAQEALAGMFQSVADHFADMVAQMIAEYLKMALIKGIMAIVGGAAGSLGGGLSSAFGASGPSFNAGAFSGAALSSGAAFGGAGAGSFSGAFSSGAAAFNPAAFSIPKLANGGVVTGPTLGLVGEGRYNEAVIPLPDGKSVPVQLSGGDGGNQINSNITVNVSNGQAQSNATGSNSSELGRKIEGAVKQVIVGELRPGGLLASR